MNTFWFVLLSLFGAVNVAILIVLLRRRSPPPDLEPLRPQFAAVVAESRRVEESLRGEFSRQREEAAKAAGALREEMALRIQNGSDSLLQRHADAQKAIELKLGTFGDSNEARLTRLRQELNESATQARNETRQGFKDFQTGVQNALAEAAKTQGAQLIDFAGRLDKVKEMLEQQFEKVRLTVEAKLAEIQTKNEQKLEEMRKTVDEKLEGTLEKRLGASFKLVSERLEQVHKGLGEMQAMASSVGDLKRVLTNVKTRGTWGEIQLWAMLEQILSPEQYMKNFAPRKESAEHVEFAIRLPGQNDEGPVWLPIDSKFPEEDYRRLLDAAEKADAQGLEEAGKAIEKFIRNQAKDIRAKYIVPPTTTDFAILFLPSESLFAEVLRRPGLAETLQREYRVVITGPTTLGALLNSLQIGFRTLAIQKRSGEVWSVLGAVKTEFGTFADVLDKVKKKLDEASNQIEATGRRTRAINRKLQEVEALPTEQAARILPETAATEDDGSNKSEDQD